MKRADSYNINLTHTKDIKYHTFIHLNYDEFVFVRMWLHSQLSHLFFIVLGMFWCVFEFLLKEMYEKKDK